MRTPPSGVRLRRGGLATAVLVAVALSGCTSNASDDPSRAVPPSAAPSSAGSSGVRTLASDLQTPWSAVFLRDGTPLISERDTGVIREVAANGRTRAIGTVRGAVHNGEGGLLGLAVAGDALYAYLTTATDNRVVRFPLEGEPGALRLGAQRVVLDGLPSASNHNGGRIAFGPDRMLYVTVGDAGRPDAAQDRTSLGGKILRITPGGGIPDDNPFPGSPVYSFGHRNPQGLAWAGDGTMYAAELGQDTWDELNRIRPGRNYGWPEVEGIANDDRFIDPVQQWSPRDASPSGMAIAGDSIYIADLRGRNLRVIPLADPTTSRVRLQGEFGRLRDVAVAPSGDLWILTSNTDGRGTPRDDDDRVVVVPRSALD